MQNAKHPSIAAIVRDGRLSRAQEAADSVRGTRRGRSS